MRTVNSKEPTIALKYNLDLGIEYIIIEEIYNILNLLGQNNIDFTIKNVNEAIKHTGFALSEDIGDVRFLEGKSILDLARLHLKMGDTSTEQWDIWKKMYEEILRFLVYKTIPPSERTTFKLGKRKQYTIVYRSEDGSTIESLINRVKIDLLDNSVIIPLVEEIIINVPFKPAIENLNEYATFLGDIRDHRFFDLTNSTDFFISFKKLINMQNDSIKEAKYRLTDADVKARRASMPSYSFFIETLEDKPMSLEELYREAKIRYANWEELLIAESLPVAYNTEIPDVEINKDNLSSINVKNLINKINENKPIVSWNKETYDMLKEDGNIDMEDIDIENAEIILDNLSKPVTSYDNLKEIVKFRSLADIIYTPELEVATPYTDDMEDFVNEIIFNTDDSDLGIDLNANKGALILKLEVSDDTIATAISKITTRIKSAKNKIEQEYQKVTNNINLSKEEIGVAARKIDKVVNDRFMSLELSSINYTEGALLKDLISLSKGKSQDTLLLNKVREHIVSGNNIFNALDETVNVKDQVEDIQNAYKLLIAKVVDSVINSVLNSCSEEYKQLINDWTIGRIEEQEVIHKMNDIITRRYWDMVETKH